MYSVCACLVVALLYISTGYCANKRAPSRSVRVSYTPKKFRTFQTSVKLTFRFEKNRRLVNSTAGQIIKINVFNRKKFVKEISKRIRSFEDQTEVEVPCDNFASAGRYFLEYFIQGLTKTFMILTPRPIIVRNERVHIEVPRNHTAFDGSVSAWLNSKHRRCKPFKGTLKLYWIKDNKEHVLVTSKIINKDKIENRTRVHFRCNVFNTEGLFYFVYFSDYNNRTVARSHNMSVSWGKYEISAQSKNIFPCSNSFVLKFSSPYCDRTEDKIEMRSKAYNNIIESQTAYHGFRSVFFSCTAFKKRIREYCFYYVTKSSLSNKRKIQATLCLPSSKAEPHWSDWSEWSNWGACTSLTDCGEGRKYRLRFCPPANLFKTSQNTPLCVGEHVESKACTLPPCEVKDKNCKSCGCVLTKPGGTIVAPKFPLSFSTKLLLPSCHWFIKIKKGMRVKLWFDALKLSRNSSILIRNGNSSSSEILKTINDNSQVDIGDIYSTSNMVSVWYSNNLIFNRSTTGFIFSYASVEKLKTSRPSATSRSSSKRLAKMTFIGILAALIVITFTIVAIIIVRIRRRRLKETAAKTPLRQPSSHTSTACMSESTMRSLYEPQLSEGDESGNNNSSYSANNSSYSVTPSRGNIHQSRMSNYNEHRAPVHVCPKCGPHNEHNRGRVYNASCHADGQRILYNDSYYGSNVDSSEVNRGRRVHSVLERRLTGTSFESDEDFPHTSYQHYL